MATLLDEFDSFAGIQSGQSPEPQSSSVLDEFDAFAAKGSTSYIPGKETLKAAAKTFLDIPKYIGYIAESVGINTGSEPVQKFGENLYKGMEEAMGEKVHTYETQAGPMLPNFKPDVSSVGEIDSATDVAKFGEQAVGNMLGWVAQQYILPGSGVLGASARAPGIIPKIAGILEPNMGQIPMGIASLGGILQNTKQRKEEAILKGEQFDEPSFFRQVASAYGSTMLERLGLEFVIGRFGIGPEAAKNIGKGLLRRIGEGMLSGAIVEGAEEAVQSYPEAYGAGANLEELLSKKQFLNALEQGLAGSIGGGFLGGAGGSTSKMINYSRRRTVDNIINNPQASVIDRLGAVNIARGLIEQENPDAAKEWYDYARSQILNEVEDGEGNMTYRPLNIDIHPSMSSDAILYELDARKDPIERVMDDALKTTDNIDDMSQKVVDDLANMDPMKALTGKVDTPRALPPATPFGMPPSPLDQFTGGPEAPQGPGGPAIPSGPSDLTAKGPEDIGQTYTAREQGQPFNIMQMFYNDLKEGAEIPELLLGEYVARGGIIPENRVDLAAKYPRGQFEGKAAYTGAGGIEPGDFYEFDVKAHPVRGPHTARFRVNRAYVTPEGTVIPLVEDFTSEKGGGLYPIFPTQEGQYGARLVKAEEAMEPGFFPMGQGPEETQPETATPNPVKVKPAKSLVRIVLDMGGLSSSKVKKAGFNVKEDFQQHGLSFIFRKKGRSLDDIATELVSSGVIPPGPDTVSSDNYVLSLLQAAARGQKTTIDQIQEEINTVANEQKNDIMELREDLKRDGYDESQIEDVVSTYQRETRETEGPQATEEDAGETRARGDETLDSDFVPEVEEPTEETPSELRPAEPSEEGTAVTPAEGEKRAQPPNGEEAGGELFDTSGMFSLSGNQPHEQKTMKIPEKKGERLLDVEKQTTDELKDRLSGEGITVETENGVRIAHTKGESKISRAVNLVDHYDYLDGEDLFEKETPYGEAVKKGTSYYRDNLAPTTVKAPAFSEQSISFTENGLEHVMGKHTRGYSEENIRRRLSLLPRVLPILESTPYVDEVRTKADGGKEYGLLGKFTDGKVVRVVVEETREDGKTFLSVFDWEDVSKKIRASLPSDVLASVGYGVGKAPSMGSKESISTESKSVKAGKEPWQMTREEFRKQLVAEANKTRDEVDRRGGGVAAYRKQTRKQLTRLHTSTKPDAVTDAVEKAIAAGKRLESFDAGRNEPGKPSEHREAVIQAISEGKAVPEEVLKDYPGLSLKLTTSKDSSSVIEPPARPRHTVEKVEGFLEPLLKKLKNVGKVKVVQSVKEIPGVDASQLSEKDIIYGAYDRDTDTTYVVADSVKDIRNAHAILIHEVIGHRGVEAVLNEDEQIDVMQAAVDAYEGTDLLKKIVKDYDLDLSKAVDVHQAGQELIAHMTESGEKPTVMQRIIGIIRDALRRLNFRLKWTDTDIRNLIQKGWRYSEGGKGLKKGEGDGQTSFKKDMSSSPDQTALRIGKRIVEETKRWKGVLSDYFNHTLRGGHLPVLMNTPQVLRLHRVGMKDLPMAITADALSKALGPKHELSRSLVEQLPVALTTPIMVFKSATQSDSFVVMTELQDNQGRWVIVPVRLNYTVSSTGNQINQITSLYGHNDNVRSGKPEWFIDQIKGGNLVYMDKEKALRWSESARLQLPLERAIKNLRNKIHTEADIVKPKFPEGSRGGNSISFRKEASSEPSLDDTTTAFKTKLNDQARAAFFSIGEKVKHPIWREIFGSPEWINHPTVRKIVDIFTNKRSERYHYYFNGLIDADNKEEGSIVDELDTLRKKGLSLTDIISGKTSKEYKLLEKAIDNGDIYHITPEKMEAWFKKTNTPEEVVKTWRRLRGSWDSALDLMQRQIKELIAENEGRQGKIPGFESTLDQLKEALAMMDEWRGSYAPRIRPNGNYVLQANKGEGDKKEFFRTHGSAREMKVLEIQMQREGWKTRVDKLQRLPEATYQNIKTVEVANLLENVLKNVKDPTVAAEMNDEIIQMVADTIRARGYRQTMIHRGEKLVTGYITDPMERFMRYTTSLSGGLSKSEIAREAMEEFQKLDPAKEPDYHRQMQSYIKENLRNIEAVDRVFGLAKSIATFKFLGFNLRSLGVNLTAIATTAPPAIHQYAVDGKVGFARISQYLSVAGKDYTKFMAGKDIGNDEEQAFLENMRKEGYDDPQYTRDAMAKMQKLHGQMWNRIMGWSMYLFGKSEQWNRGTTMLAAYRLARKRGYSVEDATLRAHEASNRAHGVYGKGTLPSWATGDNIGSKVGQAMYTYGKFGHNYVQMLADLLKTENMAGTDKRNVKAFTWAIMSPVILAGATVFPFRENIMAIFSGMLRALGVADDPEKWFWDMVREYLGDTAEKVGRHGLTGLAGVDISGSLSVGVGIPNNIIDLLGPVGGLIEEGIKAGQYISTGQPGRAAEKLLPTGLANPLRAAREATTGIVSEKGNRIWDEEGKPLTPSAGETAARVVGFRGSRQAVLSEREQEAKKLEARYKDRRDRIYEEFRAYFAEDNPSKEWQKKIWAKVHEYNDEVLDKKLRPQVPLITHSSIRNQALKMTKPTKKELARKAL